jgi:hypothetical protein
MSFEEYAFGAMHCDTDQWVPLEIRQVDDAATTYLAKVWHKKYQAIANHYQQGKDPSAAPEWTTWKPHEWSLRKDEGKFCFAAWDGMGLVGFLNLRIPRPSVFCEDREIVYIEHVCTSPGNKTTPIWRKRLGDVGSSLFAFAVLQSITHGHEGRVGLHASHEAIRFYDKLAEDAGGELFHPCTVGVSGLYARNLEQTYFETKAEKAVAFLDAFR